MLRVRLIITFRRTVKISLFNATMQYGKTRIVIAMKKQKYESHNPMEREDKSILVYNIITDTIQETLETPINSQMDSASDRNRFVK